MPTGNDFIADQLHALGVRDFFYLMGGPMMHLERACLDRGMRGIDTRHEMGAALAAHAYARISGRPGVCMACSGPGVTNLVTGVAAAYADRAPMLVLGGSSSVDSLDRGAFQDLDQVAIFKPVTKWATRVVDQSHLAEVLAEAWHRCQHPSPGPVYVDLPGDVIYRDVGDLATALPRALTAPTTVEPAQLDAVVGAITAASRPVVVAGSGVVWGGAWSALERLLDRTGLPLFTTPMARGVVSEAHPSVHPGARSQAFAEADLILWLGTRLNYVVGYGKPPRFSADATFVRVDIDPIELGSGRGDVRILAPVEALLDSLDSAPVDWPVERWTPWTQALARRHATNSDRFDALGADGAEPIHPAALARALAARLRDDDILILDGQETLNYGRQVIPIRAPRSHLNSGVLGTMGVGVPYAIGAAVADPTRRVVVLTGDGAFGMSAIELDTAVRHGTDVKVVISNNGGWTADPDGWKPGRDLVNARYDELARALGCEAERIDRFEQLDGALTRLLDGSGSGCLEVATDPLARASTAKFTTYNT